MPQPITPSLLQGAFQNFNTRFQLALTSMPLWGGRLAMNAPSNTEEEIYAWMHQIPSVRKWNKGSPRKVHRLGVNAYRLRNEKYELTEAIEREKLEDDLLGVYGPRFDVMGRQVAKFPDRQLATLIRNGGTNLCWDGLSFFNAAHPVDPNDTGAGTFANDFTGNALTQANFETAYAAWASIPAENGEVMGLQPNLLVVPPQLRPKALSILKAGVIAVTQGGGAAAVTNINLDLCQVLVVPELAADATKWYLASTDQGVMPLLHQTRADSGLISRMTDTDPAVFDLDEYITGVRIRAAFGYTLPFLMARYAP